VEGGRRKSRYPPIANRHSLFAVPYIPDGVGWRHAWNFGRIARAMVWPGRSSKLPRQMGREVRWTAAFGALAVLAPADDIC
jgi:hypothetical protein